MKLRYGAAVVLAMFVGALALSMPLAGTAAAKRPAKAPKTAKKLPNPSPAGSNPAFKAWLAKGAPKPGKTKDGHGLGYMPAPGPALKSSAAAPAISLRKAFPASFDLRTSSKLTPVRDQGTLGTCWTFATYGSMESCLLPGETADYSEDNMALQSGFWPNLTAAGKYDQGGNSSMATAYLARWGGPITELQDPYGDSTTPGGLTPAKHVSDVTWLAKRTSSLDNDRIKTALQTMGAVDVPMYWLDGSYNSTTKAYYYKGAAMLANHDVTIVGWNDSYAATNFTPNAPNNGAFIVRNSWGSGWGESGYFYVSYYDTEFAYDDKGVVVNGSQPATKYDTLYDYSPLGDVSAGGYSQDSAWMAAKYTPTVATTLNAVGFYALNPATSYEVYLGTEKTSSSRILIASGSVANGTALNMGYHVINVPTANRLSPGVPFYIIVKLTAADSANNQIALEAPYSVGSDVYSNATSAAGQSFWSPNGTTWTEPRTVAASSDVCLKAYASKPPTSSSTYTFSTASATNWKTVAQTVPLTATGGSGTNRSINYSKDGGTSWTPVVASATDLSLSDGTHHVKYYASDSMALEPEHDAGWVNVDTVAPTTTSNATASMVAPAKITATPSDATSGVAKTEYSTNGGTTWATGTSFTLSVAGTYLIKFRSTDKANNVEADKPAVSVTVRAPQVTSSCPYVFATTSSSGWKNAAQSFTITASGDGTETTIFWSLDGGSWQSAVAPTKTVTVSGDGSHSVKYYAKDSLATEAVHDAGWVNIDTVKPVTGDTHRSEMFTPEAIKLTPTDDRSGVAKTEYKVDGAATYTVGTSINLSAGPHTVAYRSTDNAGNVEDERSFSVEVRAPQLKSTCSYAFAASATTDWKNSPQTFTIDSSGDGANRSIWWSLDGGVNWDHILGVSKPVTITSDGSYHVKYYAWDGFMKETVHDAGWVNIDTVAPVTSDDHTYLFTPIYAGTTITLTPADAGSGMSGGFAKTQYRVDGASSWSEGTKVRLETPGTHSVEYWSTDKAGNSETVRKFTVTLAESVKPTSSCSYTSFSANATSGWMASAPTLGFSVTKGTGTNFGVRLSLDGGATWQQYAGESTSVPVPQGAHHVLYQAYDELWREDVHDAGWVNVDGARPTTSVKSAAVPSFGRVTLAFRIDDAAAGSSAVTNLEILRGTAIVQTVMLGVRPANMNLSYSYFASLPRGVYTMRIKAVDLAGNTTSQWSSGTLTVL